MMHPMLEKVARAIAEVMARRSLDPSDICPNEDDYAAARAAVRALMEPDQGMVEATQNSKLWRGTDWDGTEHFSEPSSDEALQVFRAMLLPLVEGGC